MNFLIELSASGYVAEVEETMFFESFEKACNYASKRADELGYDYYKVSPAA